METINKTVMEEWAESSVEFSGAIKKLLNEFNFDNIYNVKKKIRNYFPEEYLTICENRGSLIFLKIYDTISIENLRKAILNYGKIFCS